MSSTLEQARKAERAAKDKAAAHLQSLIQKHGPLPGGAQQWSRQDTKTMYELNDAVQKAESHRKSVEAQQR